MATYLLQLSTFNELIWQKDQTSSRTGKGCQALFVLLNSIPDGSHTDKMGFVVVGYVNADGNEVKIKEFLLNIFPLY